MSSMLLYKASVGNRGRAELECGKQRKSRIGPRMTTNSTPPKEMDRQCSPMPSQPAERPPPYGRFITMLAKSPLLPLSGFIFLTLTAVLSVYRARHDPWTLAFIVGAYVNLILLYCCMRAFEKLLPDGPQDKKQRLKVAIWVLTTTLNVAMAWRTSDMMPWFMSAVIWIMVVLVTFASFYVMFVYKESATIKESCSTEPSPDEKV